MFLKRLCIGLALAAALALAIVGASSGAKDAETKNITMLSVAGDPGFHTYELGAQAAAKALGANLYIGRLHDFSGDAQIQLMNQLAARKPDALLVTALNAPAIQATLHALAQRGITIVMYDSNAANQKAIPAPTYVASQYYELGRDQAQYLAKQIGHKGLVQYIQLFPGNGGLFEHQQGFMQALKKWPNIDVLPVQFNNGENAKTSAIVTATLARHPDLAGVFVNTNSAGADGGYAAIRQAHKVGKVVVVSIDATPSGIKALKAGYTQLVGSFQMFNVGHRAVESAVGILNGKKYPAKQLFPACLITRANLNSSQSKKCIYVPLGKS